MGFQKLKKIIRCFLNMERQFLRRIKKRTNYKRRLALLKSGLPRLVIKKSINNIHVQIISYERQGDKTLLEDVTKNLRKLGWKGHCGNMPSAYLIGYKIGKAALAKGIKSVVPDIGLQDSTKENVLYAAVKGAKDAGLNINLGKIAADDKKIKGSHISEYAKKLKSENEERYQKQFSSYIKSGLNPADIEKHFEEIKSKIGA